MRAVPPPLESPAIPAPRISRPGGGNAILGLIGKDFNHANHLRDQRSAVAARR